MTRADWIASLPKCDRLCGPLAARGACGQPMRWVTLTSPEDGRWCCGTHGPMLSGSEAAMRAGFVSVVKAGPESEAA